MDEMLSSGQLAGLVQQYGSPLNLISTEPLRRNISELEEIARERSMMHFLESRSHQFPLAKNIVHGPVSVHDWKIDPIDSVT